VDNGRVTDVICLYFCKVFDMVPQNIIATKLDRHGFDGWTIRWVRNWLAGCVQRVAVNGSVSKWKPVTRGVSTQGSVLGLILPSIFINDIDSGIECTLSNFADNTRLNGAVDLHKGKHAIQRHFNRRKDWARVNSMKFKKAKGEVLHLGQGNHQHQFRLGDE